MRLDRQGLAGLSHTGRFHAYGVEVTPERVARVDAAEVWLRTQLGIRELRVRLEANDLARIEVPVAAVARLTDDDLRQRTAAHLRSLGFRYVTIDLEGFRSGSLNAALPPVDLVPLLIPRSMTTNGGHDSDGLH